MIKFINNFFLQYINTYYSHLSGCKTSVFKCKTRISRYFKEIVHRHRIEHLDVFGRPYRIDMGSNS